MLQNLYGLLQLLGHIHMQLWGLQVVLRLLLLAILSYSMNAYATVQVPRYQNGYPVTVCQPSDSNTSCGGGGGGVGVGTINTGTQNYVSVYQGNNSTLGPSTIPVYDNGTNMGIGSVNPGQKLDVNGTVRVSGVIQSSSIDADQAFNVKNYNAKGDGIQLSDGAITSGLTTFTSATASFTSADVGKVISIVGAGGSLINLTTTIASVTNATTVEVTNAASATVSGKVFTYGTDDTVAIQATIDATSSNGGGTVFFPKGIYVINGAFSNPATDNSVIHLPSIDVAATVQPVAISLKGIGPVYLNYGITQKNGSILMFTTTGGSAGMNFIGVYGGATTINSQHFSGIHVRFQDLIIHTIQNPVNNVVNLTLANNASMDNVLIEPLYSVGTQYANAALATNSSSYGLITPGTSNHAVSSFNRVIVFNYYNNYQLWEHANLNFSGSYGAVNGIEIPKDGHPRYLNWVSSELNQNHIVATTTGTGASNRIYGSIHVENGTGSFAQTVQHILDASNLLTGELNLTTLNSQSYLISGANFLSISTLSNNSTQPYVFGATGNIGIGTAILPDAKLVVRGTAGAYQFQVNDGTRKTGLFQGTSIVSSQAGGALLTRTNDNLFLGVNGATHYLEINTAGNVGIDTYSLNNKLSINGNLSVGSVGNIGIAGPSNGAFIQGNVGIGTDTSPDAQLEVVRSAPNTPFMISSTVASDGDYMIVKNDGNIGVGSVTPGQALDVVGTIRMSQLTASAPVISASDKSLASGSYKGNTTVFQMNNGTLTNGNLTKADSNQNIVDAGVSFGTLTDTKICTYSSGTTSIACTSSAGSGTPAGASPQIQYNNASSFGGIGSGGSDGTNIGIGTVSFTSRLNVAGNVGIATLANSRYLNTTLASPIALVIDGNVGIGTVSPKSLLQIVGNLGIGTSPSSGNYIGIGTTPTNAFILTVDSTTGVSTGGQIAATSQSPTGGGEFDAQNDVGDQLELGMTGSNYAFGPARVAFFLTSSATPLEFASNYFSTLKAAFRINSDNTNTFNTNVGVGTSASQASLTVPFGNIGIGTITPLAGLQIVGNIGIGTVKNGDNFIMTTPPAGGMIIEGNVGIGSWNPQSALDIRGTTSNGAIENFTATSVSGIASIILNNDLGNQVQLLMSGSSYAIPNTAALYTSGTVAPALSFWTNGGEAMRITTAQNVGIGTTAPQALLTVGSGGHFKSNGTAPTVANNDCGSTVQGTIAAGSTDIKGSITVGTLNVTSCAMTFAATFGKAPICITQDDTNVLGIKSSTTTTKLTVTATTSMSSDVVNYLCIE